MCHSHHRRRRVDLNTTLVVYGLRHVSGYNTNYLTSLQNNKIFWGFCNGWHPLLHQTILYGDPRIMATISTYIFCFLYKGCQLIKGSWYEYFCEKIYIGFKYMAFSNADWLDCEKGLADTTNGIENSYDFKYTPCFRLHTICHRYTPTSCQFEKVSFFVRSCFLGLMTSSKQFMHVTCVFADWGARTS